METKLCKYPKTLHLPWSPGSDRTDRILNSITHFEGHEIVVTLKMDGENTTCTRERCYARSLDSKAHESRTWIKGLWASIKQDIPEGWRICGENLYAVHSIEYKNLDDLFLVFSIWNEKNECLSWDETVEFAALLGLKTVPLLHRGMWDESFLRSFVPKEHEGDPCEGFVIRKAGSYRFEDFATSLAKYVRASHVKTDEHWMHQKVKRNGVR
jgi:hypothetical protein